MKLTEKEIKRRLSKSKENLKMNCVFLKSDIKKILKKEEKRLRRLS